MGQSNPVSGVKALGGVASNLAVHFKHYGHNVAIQTVCGYDYSVIPYLQRFGIDTSLIKTLKRIPTASYTAAIDPRGNIIAALENTEIYNSMTPDFFEDEKDEMVKYPVWVVEVNIPEESVEKIASLLPEGNRCFGIMVNPYKAPRMRPILDKLEILFCNKLEVQSFCDVKITSIEQAKQVVKSIKDMGPKKVFMTMGADGIVYADENDVVFWEVPEVEIVNEIGAGDGFAAGVIEAMLHGKEPFEAVQEGFKLAHQVLKCSNSAHGRLAYP